MAALWYRRDGLVSLKLYRELTPTTDTMTRHVADRARPDIACRVCASTATTRWR